MRAKLPLLFLLLAVCLGCTSPSRRGVILLCAGDSLTERGYPPFLRRLFKKSGIRARVLNFGRSGNTSAEYLGFLEEQKGAMAAAHPDFILLELGTNDVRLDGDRTETAGFSRNLARIIGIFREFADRRGVPPRILLATIPPVPEDVPHPFGRESSERVTNEINPAIRRLAAAEGLSLVDNFGLFSMSSRLLSGVHPTDEGYKLMAENWLRVLRELMD